MRLTRVPAGEDSDKDTISPAVESSAADGFVPLFNGKDLKGWHVEGGGTDQWTVEDGALLNRKRGSLLSDMEYADFVFRFQFRMETETQGSISIRAEEGEPRTANNRREAYGHPKIILKDPKKYVEPSGTHDLLSDNKAAHRPTTRRNLANGNWHDMEITVRGDRCITVIDGDIIFDVKLDPDPEQHKPVVPALKRIKGRIGFQVNNGAIRFRNVEIK